MPGNGSYNFIIFVRKLPACLFRGRFAKLVEPSARSISPLGCDRIYNE